MTGMHLQTELLNADHKHINYVALYDLAPRFVHYVERDGGPYLKAVARRFVFGGKSYRVTVSPARIVHADGTETDEFPGELEQIVEDVLRRAMRDRKFSSPDGETIQTNFSIYALEKELAAHGHATNRRQIKQALLVLNKCNIEIVPDVDADEENGRRRRPKALVSAPALPVLAFRDIDDPNSTASAQFNPLIAHAIKSLAVDPVSYEWLMRVKGSMERWVFKSLSIRLLGDDEAFRSNSLVIRATEILDGYGHTQARLRDNLLRVEKAIQAMKRLGVIRAVEIVPIKNGRTKVDTEFLVSFTEEFYDDRMRARDLTQRRKRHVLEKTGKESVGEFVAISDGDRKSVQMEFLL